MRRLGVIVMTAAWLGAAASVSGQPVARVTGTVTTTNGGDLSGVTVVARNRRTGEARQATTGADGSYVIGELAAGDSYDIQAQLAGFAPVVRENVTPSTGSA